MRRIKAKARLHIIMENIETLARGSRGHYVELVQLALIRSGYLSGSPDGIFGGATADAVTHFQRANGIPATGEVDEQTWRRLMPYLAGYSVRTVRPGDTYWKLAHEFYTDPSAIAAANPGVDPNDLRPGMQIIIPFGFPVVPENVSWSSDLCEIVVAGLIARYPFMRSEIIGNSVIGSNIYALSLGEGPRRAMLNASHHANEWITTPFVLKYAEQYAKARLDGGSVGGVAVGDLWNRVTLDIVPMVNPDGVDLVSGALDSGVWYDGARRISNAFKQIPFPSGWKANILGTDLNLNYPAGWEQAKRIKYAMGYNRPAPRDFVGAAPLAAPEAFAMTQYTEKNSFDLTISFHTQGEVIYWKYLDIVPTGSLEIAQAMSQASGYTVEDTPAESGYAGYKDWFILTYNRPGYTVEAGRGTSPLPLTQFPEIWQRCAALVSAALAKI